MLEKFQTENQELQKVKPYVVSADIQLLLTDWARRQNFTLPQTEFFIELRQDFTNFFGRVFELFELIPESVMVNGLQEVVDGSNLYPVSLDRVYYQSQQALDITRYVDSEGKDMGLGRRMDGQSLLKQFRKLKKSGIQEVTLVDDVIFTGDLMRRVITQLEKMGIKVPIICSGIAITEGIKRLNGFGHDVRSVKEYPAVIDEVCERDFYPGVPLCGRSLVSSENIGVPYILPFGNPQKWASIQEEYVHDVSHFCLGQTIKLFEAIEEKSGREVQCCDLERGVFQIPRDKTRFVDVLKMMTR